MLSRFFLYAKLLQHMIGIVVLSFACTLGLYLIGVIGADTFVIVLIIQLIALVAGFALAGAQANTQAQVAYAVLCHIMEETNNGSILVSERDIELMTEKKYGVNIHRMGIHGGFEAIVMKSDEGTKVAGQLSRAIEIPYSNDNETLRSYINYLSRRKRHHTEEDQEALIHRGILYGIIERIIEFDDSLSDILRSPRGIKIVDLTLVIGGIISGAQSTGLAMLEELRRPWVSLATKLIINAGGSVTINKEEVGKLLETHCVDSVEQKNGEVIISVFEKLTRPECEKCSSRQICVGEQEEHPIAQE